MAMTVSQIRLWLSPLSRDQHVGVDEGGLTLRCVERPDLYCEIGGIPEDEYTGTSCPNCHGGQVFNNGDVVTHGKPSILSRDVYCGECKAAWTETFEATGYELLKTPGKDRKEGDCWDCGHPWDKHVGALDIQCRASIGGNHLCTCSRSPFVGEDEEPEDD
jgi:hypothetical protein